MKVVVLCKGPRGEASDAEASQVISGPTGHEEPDNS